MKIIKKIEDYPVIYLRYLNNKLLYVGESISFIKSRHCRDDIDAGDFDLIKVLKAPKNLKRRKYWEAYLICKLNPINQNISKYNNLIERTNGTSNKKCYYRSTINKEDHKKNILHSAYLNLEKFNRLMKIYKQD